jgi:hypothetical protein
MRAMNDEGDEGDTRAVRAMRAMSDEGDEGDTRAVRAMRAMSDEGDEGDTRARAGGDRTAEKTLQDINTLTGGATPPIKYRPSGRK